MMAVPTKLLYQRRVNSFQDEFQLLLDRHEIEYDEKYILGIERLCRPPAL